MRKILSYILVGCSLWVAMQKGSFMPQPLDSLCVLQEGFFQDDHLTLSIRPLTEEECLQVLQVSLQDLGYQPVQITLQNQSSDPYLFTIEGIDLPTVDPDTVAGKVFIDSLPRSVLLQIASFFFWPFMIPSSVHSLLTWKAHAHRKNMLASKSLTEETVAPYSVLHRVFFVEKDIYEGPFQITMQNQNTLVDRIFLVQGDKEGVERLHPLPILLENYYLTHEG